jgi:hypothetical protein
VCVWWAWQDAVRREAMARFERDNTHKLRQYGANNKWVGLQFQWDLERARRGTDEVSIARRERDRRRREGEEAAAKLRAEEEVCVCVCVRVCVCVCVVCSHENCRMKVPHGRPFSEAARSQSRHTPHTHARYFMRSCPRLCPRHA